MAGFRGGRLSRFEWACLAFVVLGLATRLLSFAYRDLHWDAAWYMCSCSPWARWAYRAANESSASPASIS